MGTPAEHVERARHNERFIKTFADPYWDWVVTVAFYSALHWMQAYLVKHGQNPGVHTDRNACIQQDTFLQTLWNDYAALQNNSRDARYDVVPFTGPEAQRITTHLATIKTAIDPKVI